MVVKKKAMKVSEESDMIDSPELSRVREAIGKFSTDPEGDVIVATKKEAPKKEAAKKAPAAKKEAAKPAAKKDDNRVTLAVLCEELGIKPAAARRKLRTAEIDRGDGQWAWAADSKELAAVKKALAPPKAD